MAITVERSSASMGKAQIWRWRDQTVHYVRVGEGAPDRPPLLLVHGFGASTDHWRKNLAELQADFEV